MLNYRVSVPVVALALAACSKDQPTPDPAKEVMTAAPSSATAATTAAPAAPATATAAAAASTAAAPAAAPVTPTSPEPTLKEWDTSKLDPNVIKNWNGPGCIARRIREWIRVGCSQTSTHKGPPVSIDIIKGFPSAQLNVLQERAGTTMLVFPAKEGLDAEATFNFAEGSFSLVASWPAGQPEPKALAEFKEIERPVEPPAAAEAEPGGGSEATPAPAKLEKAIVTNEPLPSEPVIEGAPTAEQWASAKEVGVKGSDALGCETKVSGDWFRMVCRSNNNTGKVTAATAIQGFDPKQGYLVTGNGALILLTKYVKGTDTAIDITWERTAGRFNLKWPETLAIPPALRGELVVRP